MTKDQLEYANELDSKTRAAKFLIVNGAIEPSNFMYLFNKDSEFKKDFDALTQKYYDKYNDLFKQL